MKGLRANVLLLFAFLLSTSVHSIDIDFDDKRDGFFLKSPYHKFKPAEPSIVRESLILTHPAEVYKLRASYGPLEMYKVVPNKFLSSILKFGETFDKSEIHVHRQVIHNMDVSAHIVNHKISRTNPFLQVLIHAQPLIRHQKDDLIYSYYGYSQRWCAQIFATKGEEKYTSACLLNGDGNACVTGLHLPDQWWSLQNATSLSNDDVLVFYHISRVEQNQECASVSNTIVPGRAELHKADTEKKFISSLELLEDSISYDEQRDRDLIFKIPQIDLRPNVGFEVPVLLEKNSGLKEFVMKIKVRGDLEIEGAVESAHSPWSVLFEPGNKEGLASVTVSLKKDVKYTKSYRVEEIMRWRLRVAEHVSTTASTTARCWWTVDYKKNGLSRNSFYRPDESRIAVKFSISQTQAETIVPVLKERSLLNTAILTGKSEMYGLQVYTVTPDNSFRDVTKDSNCRSTDPEALKVSVSCKHIYVDGSETRGAKNVTMLVRTADQMAQFGVRVWVPEPKLDIQFSDNKLSMVRGWKVPWAGSRNKRRADRTLLPDPSLFNGTKISTPLHQACRHKYQQAVVDVYARFVISLPGEAPRYYRNKKTFVRVTELVKDRLKVSNRNVAKMVGTTVQGIAPGKTDVQVIAPTGKLLGSKEVRVGKDKVEIERLMVRVISAIDMEISEDRNLPGALMAEVTLHDILIARQQEAVLDTAVQFKDGTMIPLAMIDPKEYNLKVTSVNTDVVEVSETISTMSMLPPSIKAIGNGKGDIIKVILKENGSCSRKKVRTLDTEYVHVLVDFSKEMDFFNQAQRDGISVVEYPNKKDYLKQQHENYFKQQQLHQENGKSAKSNDKVYKIKSMDKLGTFTASETNAESHTEEPLSEPLEQPVSTKAKHPSPLEIGMYVLVAVFIFAVLVFTANCAVFTVRYQRKRSAKGTQVMTGSISQAPDWVWIGRATLERHGARNTGCNQPLMAEEDFNGNQMVVPNSLPSSKSSSKKPSGLPANGKPPGRAGSGKGAGSAGSSSNRDSIVSTYKGSECSIRITSNPLPDDDSGMGYNEAEWDYEAMGMTYEQLMEYFDNLKESSA